jgi:hypothetical protein
LTFPDASWIRYKPENRKATQNKPTQNANTTVVDLLIRKKSNQLKGAANPA